MIGADPCQRPRVLLAAAAGAADAERRRRCCSARSSAREAIPKPGTPEHLKRHRIQLKLGNRDLTGADFRWVDEAEIASASSPRDAVYVERREYGPFIGTPVRLIEGEREIAAGADAVWQALQPLIDKAARRSRPASATSSATRSAPSTTDRSRRGSSCAGSSSRGSGADVATGVERRIEQQRRRAARPNTPQPRRRLARHARAGIHARASSLPGRRRRREGTADARPLPRLSRQRAVVRGQRVAVYASRSGSSCPAIRANRTPRAASSRRSSAP